MLYICATPIGNLEDITLRVLKALQQADVIFAEDTRHSLALLNHFEIKKPLYSCHEHNEKEKSMLILDMVKQGKEVVLISDAGLPGISDPGAEVVKAAAKEGIPFTVLPGACAAVTALVHSALDTDRFIFYGFLPRDKKPRREILTQIEKNPYTGIIYESPYRLVSTLHELLSALGNRKAAVCRELTKYYEECARGDLEYLCKHFSEPKGECVILIEGKMHEAIEIDIDAVLEQMKSSVDNGMRSKEAAKLLAKQFGLSANELYNQYLKINQS